MKGRKPESLLVVVGAGPDVLSRGMLVKKEKVSRVDKVLYL